MILHATWTELKYIEWNPHFIEIKLDSDSIEKKRDVNWCKKYGKSICDYGDDQKIIYEKKPFHSSLFEN
jgi:hypothetical protein